MAATGSLLDPLLPPPLQKEASNTSLSKDPTQSSGLLLRELKRLNTHVADITDDDRQRKHTYLSQLPPDQIIELCLAFEQHVPEPIRRKIWPLDLEVAIPQLKKSPLRTQAKSPTTAEPVLSPDPLPTKALSKDIPPPQAHPPGETSFELPVQPLDVSFPTISSGDVQATVAPIQEPTPAIMEEEPTIPDSEAPAQPEEPPPSSEIKSTEPSVETATGSAPEQTSSPATPTLKPPAPASSSTDPPVAPTSTNATTTTKPSASNTPQPTPTPTPLASYPYAPYGYPVQPGYPAPTGQAAYPHAPYYPPHGAAVPGYPAPYPGFSYPPPPGYPSHPPSQAPPVSNEDLPSYEDMIVEALLDIGEPDGAAPKDLFLWMGARWPLQTNFRPSASQALQKAYRRGRLEKRSGGRYRLNPNWEGGAVSTRMLCTPAQGSYATDVETDDSKTSDSRPNNLRYASPQLSNAIFAIYSRSSTTTIPHFPSSGTYATTPTLCWLCIPVRRLSWLPWLSIVWYATCGQKSGNDIHVFRYEVHIQHEDHGRQDCVFDQGEGLAEC